MAADSAAEGAEASQRLISYYHCDNITEYSSVEANLLKPHILKCGHAIATLCPLLASRASAISQKMGLTEHLLGTLLRACVVVRDCACRRARLVRLRPGTCAPAG